MICFHHNDLDGRCAAAIVFLVYPTCRFIEMDYRSELPIDYIGKDEEVFIVDFSFQRPGDWTALFARTTNVCWIDHHETAIAKAPPLARQKGLTRTDACGALLTWEYFMRKPIPEPLRLVDLWDRWEHDDRNEVLDFVSGMKVENTEPVSSLWGILLLDDESSRMLLTIQRQGRIVRRYEDEENHRNLEQFGHEVNLDGYRCLAINSIRRSSLVFGSRLKDYNICIAYVYDGKQWIVSLYSDKVKVNDVTKSHGGGGHPGAAGFICDALPF